MLKKSWIYLIIILSSLFITLISNTDTISAFENESGILGHFEVGNEAPPAPLELSIQDNETHWDNTTGNIDTHDIKPSIRWINGTDPNGDAITTHICIATSEAIIGEFIAKDSTDCAYTTIAIISSVSNITDSDINFSSINTTYYITLIPDDGELNGTELNATIYFLNSLPVASNFGTTTTHNQSPVVNWSVTDADDDSEDHWPADIEFYHYIWLGNDTNYTAYYTNMSAENDSTLITSTLPWGVPGADWANRTINVTIMANDTYLNSTEYNITFVLYDYLPHINDVQMVDIDSYGGACAVAGHCLLNPIEHNNTNVSVRLNVTDTDGDCSDSNHEAWIMLCLNTTPTTDCDESSYNNYSWEIDSVNTVGTSDCIFTFTTNKTEADSTPEFFRVPGTYKLHINVTSQAGERNKSNQSGSNATWQYATLKAVNYSSSVLLGGGSPTLDEWNSGTHLYPLTNWGNDILVMQWNASDPTHEDGTGPGKNWTLNNTDFAIDDDANHNTDTEDIPWNYVNATLSHFNHTTGLERCIVQSCDDENTNQTLDTYYHIHPLFGLIPGTYNTTITLELSSKG